MQRGHASGATRNALLALIALATSVMGLVPTGYEAEPGWCEFTGRVIVRPIQSEAWAAQELDVDKIAQRRAAALEAIGCYELQEHVRQTDEFIVQVPVGEHENEVIARLDASGLFEYAEPDWRVFPAGCPNDPRLAGQWHHDDNRLESCQGWDLHTGDPRVGIGLCDTGVRTTHEDLESHRLEGYNAVDRVWENHGGEIDDINGHGTMTTGCAAANGDNALGVVGVGWHLGHRMLRVSNDPDGSAPLSTLQHAARISIESGDRVATVGYSGVDAASNFTTATYIKSIGGLLVWAAGNDGRYLLGDRDDDDLIVVGATNIEDARAVFSAYGPLVDIVAPGVSVYTTTKRSDSSYDSATGSSFANPLAAALCALIWSANPEFSPNRVELMLKRGADDLGDVGPDDDFGHGRINISGSLELIERPLEFEFSSGLPELLDPYGDTSVRVEILAGGAIPEPGSGSFFIDEGQGFVEYAMVHLGDNLYDAEFPALSCGANVQYYFSARTTEDVLQNEPSNAPLTTFEARSAYGLIAVFADDFEADNGWNIENIELLDGAWERGMPVGDGERGDPTEDFDGSGQCYLTGNENGNSDVDGGPTRLYSPTIDMSVGDGLVRYARWFANDDGDRDRLDVEISNYAGGNWTLIESIPAGTGWVEANHWISEFLAPTGDMRLRFSATDNPNNSITEAALDAFEVLVVDCSPQLFVLDVDTLIAGQEATAYASRADPSEPVFFQKSTEGPGETYLSRLEITVDMVHPALAGWSMADTSGNASFTDLIPEYGVGVDVWLQAAQVGRKSNLVETTIE